MEEVDKEISEMKLFVSSTLEICCAFLTVFAVERQSKICCRIFSDTGKLGCSAVFSTNNNSQFD